MLYSIWPMNCFSQHSIICCGGLLDPDAHAELRSPKSLLWNFTGCNNHFFRGVNASKNDYLKRTSWITGSVWLCCAFDLLLLFVSFCTDNRAAVTVLNLFFSSSLSWDRNMNTKTICTRWEIYQAVFGFLSRWILHWRLLCWLDVLFRSTWENGRCS